MKWSLLSDHTVHLHFWDDECVAYNKRSGDTHLLGPMATQIVLKLQQSPSDALTLAESIKLLPTDETNDELPLQIEHMLADLDQLSLISFS